MAAFVHSFVYYMTTQSPPRNDASAEPATDLYSGLVLIMFDEMMLFTTDVANECQLRLNSL